MEALLLLDDIYDTDDIEAPTLQVPKVSAAHT